MLDYMWERGWDAQYGGILYFKDVYDSVNGQDFKALHTMIHQVKHG